MAFNQYNLERVHDQSRGGFDLFVYRNMDDTIAEITAPNYFDPDKFGFKSPGDSAKLIKVSCADGDYEVKLSGGVASLAGSVLSSARLMNKITTNQDAVVLTFGDSTGNESFEFLYKFAEWINATYPQYTVNYYLWDVSNKEFPATPTQVFTGTGSQVVDFYNGSVGGSRNDYMLGERFSNFAIGKNADLIICNYGHNIADNLSTESYLNDLYCMYLACISQTVEANPDAGCIVMLQNPQQSNTKLLTVRTQARACANNLNCDYVDAYQVFEDLGKSTIYYLPADVVHPNENGQSLIFNALLSKIGNGTEKPAKNIMELSGDGLIPDSISKFTGWSGTGLPSGFLRSGNATLTRDTAVFESSKGFSVKIESASAGAGNTFIQHELSSESLALCQGKTMTVGMRFRRPLTATPITSGKVEIFLDSTTRIETDEHDNLPIGGWHYRFMSAFVPTGTTSIKLNFYADDGTTDAIINVDSVQAWVGELAYEFKG